MSARAVGAEAERALEHVLGYLNFSSGAADPQLLSNLNRLYELIGDQGCEEAPWKILLGWLKDKLGALQQSSPTFRNGDQASAMVNALLPRVLSDYRHFHRDLLFHQTDRTLFGPFFVGRVCEVVLRQGSPWNDAERISQGAIRQLNDYIGHRPVATLESQKIEPYPHEWVRPIPLYIRDAGIAVGPPREVIHQALQLLAETDEALLRAAHFNPDLLDELAIDPRAYDFDHPVNKRPNYHFGQWDPHHIDHQGRYRRFVVQQVTLEALMKRVEQPGDLPQDEVVFEAAAVLAGTILMASGISGSGPDTHDSSVTLTSLLPEIAAYRDAFYEQLFAKMDGRHAERLRQEAEERQQPFGAARQHLNAELACRRASQLEHVHLALLFARIGYPDAAARQAQVVPAASARLRCRIDCRLTEGMQAVKEGDLRLATNLVAEIVDMIQRAIQCGAFIDPWNILGFHANFSLFPALENSIHDHRADELVDLMEQLFSLYSRIWSEAAASDNQSLSQQISAQFQETAQWWHKFAAHEVSSVPTSDALENYRASQRVAEAMNLWHKGGAAAGDVGFWGPHVEMFNSVEAYALVVNALLDRRDFVASMALLIHWLGQAERVGLGQGDRSLHQLAERWMLRLQQSTAASDSGGLDISQAWKLAQKFFDYLEANADEYWSAPEFELGSATRAISSGTFAVGEEQDDDPVENLYHAAYEDVVYRDSTDDGIDHDLLDSGDAVEDELERAAKRMKERIAFLSTLARLWSIVATGPFFFNTPSTDQRSPRGFAETIRSWFVTAAVNRRDLLRLLHAVQRHRLPSPGVDHDSLVEYDRRRLVKESLLDRIVETCVETTNAIRHLLAAVSDGNRTDDADPVGLELDEDLRQSIAVFGCMMRQDVAGARRKWTALMQAYSRQPLLYVPLTKGGDPAKIVAARVRQQSIADLSAGLPRLGLLSETRQLLDTARQMEREQPVGPGAVTEFDELFKIGYKAVVQCLVTANQPDREPGAFTANDQSGGEPHLISCLEKATEAMLISWLAHSRTLRLSVLERVHGKPAWDRLVAFIQRYGEELFTQKFFNLGNIRAILHEGVDVWLRQLEKEPCEAGPVSLLQDLDAALPREDAVEHLSLILEAIVENYGEYRDYNSTTTQSDHGQLLYMLLDFLRLRTQYDRVSWNLKPVVWAHEILLRQGLTDAAKAWRRSLTERIGKEADKYVVKLTKLQKKYAMRMPTVADRIGERFVRPMLIDRIRALIEPAMRAADRHQPSKEIELLEEETELLTRQPTGVGLDVPAWLIALEDEVEQVLRPAYEQTGTSQLTAIPRRTISLEEAQRQIDEWMQRD